MKIFNAKQLREIDQATIKNEPIQSIDLMERAASKCYHWLQDQGIEDREIHIFCGMGNNGGDGLAIARMMYEDNYMTATNIVHFSETMSDDFVTNYKRAEKEGVFPLSIHSEDDFPKIHENDIVIDAIFGVGLNRKPQGFTKKLIQHINASGATVYAIDVPSGLFIDKPVSDVESVIKANVTLTFQTPKLAFLLPDNKEYLNDFVLLDIGLDSKSIVEVSTGYQFTMEEDIQVFFKERDRFSHKGDFGHSLIIAGSFGKIGAAVLASKAALRIGSGLVTAYIPKCGYSILQSSIPEVMVEVDAENTIEFINYKTEPSVVGIGPGLGTSAKTAKALGAFLKQNKLPLVIDADGLNILSKNKGLLNLLPENTVLTPHPKELERLIGSWDNDYDKLEKIKSFSTQYNCILVLKGQYTAIVKDGMCYFNSTGSAALATAGTGDVLTGMITGLIAQKYSPLQAAIMAVFVHGRSGEIAEISPIANQTVIASDLFLHFQLALFSIFNPSSPEEGEMNDEEMDRFLDDYFDEDNDDEPPF